ncbi:MAG: triple tyrosine motif-containing protein [Flavobacteriaceae bacterium]|nr:triple tyrosine motif-containing protein [Flavobacteriaceae bacterium]
MKMKKVYPYLLIFLFTIGSLDLLYGQEISPIQVFTPQQTNLGNQNWMISQGNDQTVYFANNQGLVSYNASQWKLYPAEDNSIIRSVKVINDRVYSSSYRDFGFWERDKAGELQYTSLSKVLGIDILEDEQFWNIIKHQEKVVFKSFNRLIFFHPETKEISFISTKNTLLKSFKLGEQLYYQVQDEGLYQAIDGKAKLISNAPLFKDQSLVNLFQQNKGFMVVTQENGLYSWQNNQLSPWTKPNKILLKQYNIYSAIQLNNKGYALGTVGKGLLILSEEGTLIQELNKEKGLSNNTVLSLFEDQYSNLWLGLDNGINLINRSSGFKEYIDVNGQLGSIYTSSLHKGYLYLGTNQGLYVKKRKNNEKFKLIEKTEGQVWNLTTIDGTLFCGHNRGALLVKGEEVELVSGVMGTWLFKQHPSQSNLIFMGNYTGLYVLEKKAGTWVYRNKISGFDISSRFFEFSAPSQIIVNHEYKGVFKIKLDQDYQKAIDIELDPTSCISCNASLVNFNENIYYQAKDKLYKYNQKENVFKKDSLLSNLSNVTDFHQGKLLNDPLGELWLFTKNNLYNIKKGNKVLANGVTLNEKDRKNVSGFEHINLLKEKNYLIGTNKGYLTVDLNNIDKEKTKPKLSSINANNKQENRTVNLNEEGTLPFEYNNLSIQFTSYDFNRYGKTRFQYILEGEDEQWSNWTENTSIDYANLDYGKYSFKLRSKKGNTVSEIITSPIIYINPPWHLNRIAISIYAIVFVILLMLYNNYYKQKLKRQRNSLEKENKRLLEIQELEAQKEIIRLKNEQLQKDIEGKSRELAVATMSTLKRNEYLNSIKAELETIKGEAKAKKLIKSINTKLKNNDDWEYFKKAFDNTDQPLFSKLKVAHPSLTKNDLKLCAYLRLNLSSKEIAPLLNISVHSVEIKRYRLRKKMGLERSQGIVEYIMLF